MLQGITRLVTGDRVLADLAKLLSLSELCQEPLAVTKSSRSQHQLATLLKATIGWMYHQDPNVADAWGLAWFGPIVLRAHDILTDEYGSVFLYYTPSKTIAHSFKIGTGLSSQGTVESFRSRRPD